MYHVVFELNPRHKATNFLNTSQIELGMLVKNVQLPKYDFGVEERNMYNKKTYFNTRITYQPINMTFHDDMKDVVTAFWSMYYQYYIADGRYPEAAFDRPSRYSRTGESHRWGMDTEVGGNLIKTIKIYQLYKGNYIEWALMEPKITNFSHADLDQSATGSVAEQTMTVAYNGVLINQGKVSRNSDKPEGLTSLHYDRSPSPLSIIGGGTDSIFGPGGLIPGGISVFKNFQSGNIFGGILGAINLYKRRDNYKKGFKEEIVGIGRDILRDTAFTMMGAGSPPGMNFPKGTRKRKVDAISRDAFVSGQTFQPRPNLYAVDQDGFIILTPDEATRYYTHNTEALDRLARDTVYLADTSKTLDENKSAWNRLTDAEKTVYTSQALALVPNLVNSGVVRLRLDKDVVKTFQTINKETLAKLSKTTTSTATATARATTQATTQTYSSGGGGGSTY
tara:strand:- start:15950 stop:17299 length:1350 start_codon:yes stop_codon:yes gene_type:complete